MTTERLEELRKIKTGFDFVMGLTPDLAEGRRAGLTDDQTEIIVNHVYQALSRNLLALIDAEIARQTVTDDADVAEAIDDVESVKGYLNDVCNHQSVITCDSLDLAITALRQKRQATDSEKRISDSYGDYSRQVIMEVGDKRIQCDYEIASEIAYLNLIGIETIASCSGHGKQTATVAVTNECERKMLELGYKRLVNDFGAVLFALRQYQTVTEEAVKRAIEWAEQERKNSFRYMDFGDADSAALAIQALRQMNIKKPCEICANFKRVDCKADWLEFTAVYCPNCGKELVK